MPIYNFDVEENQENLPPLERPKINWLKIILILLMTTIITGASSFLIYYFFGSLLYSILCFVLLNILLILLFFGRIIICLTKIYQRYAKEEIRRRCVYTPTCSQYMILSIKKYGGFKGFVNGIKRLQRCHPPHGGVDNP